MIEKIIQGDCLEKLKELETNSVDSIVTDPPYELGFMGKSWDNTGIANNVELWQECLRVLKPGGHLLSFGGTRTYHRMASAIEDAGFEVRDMIEWVYSTGFPKSLNIGKAVDKLQGNEREVVGQSRNGANSLMGGLSGTETTTIQDVTKGTSAWEGWGTALKPAHEPICMARKPLAEKNVALNVLKWGTGGINIDESRVGTEDKLQPSSSTKMKFGGNAMLESSTMNDPNWIQNELGRFPANLIHDNSEEVRECFPESKGGAFPKTHGSSGFVSPEEKESRLEMNDSGNASRFFKSIKKDFEYSPKYAILKLCENNINVNNAENNLKTTSQIELVANIFSALKSATPNLDLLNQNLNALFVEKSADSTEIDFVARCVAIKEIPEELVSQQEYTVFQDFMEDYKKCFQTQKSVDVEKWGNIDITQIMISLLKLCGFVLPVINENTHSGNQEGQQCDYKSLIYKAKASKSERNMGCEELEEKIFSDRNPELDSADMPQNRSGNAKSNFHPTVKPIALMEYLIKMVTPKGGIVLDPFAGSGSTLVAARRSGFQFIGIEKEEEYIPIIEARLKSVEQQLLPE